MTTAQLPPNDLNPVVFQPERNASAFLWEEVDVLRKWGFQQKLEDWTRQNLTDKDLWHRNQIELSGKTLSGMLTNLADELEKRRNEYANASASDQSAMTGYFEIPHLIKETRDMADRAFIYEEDVRLNGNFRHSAVVPPSIKEVLSVAERADELPPTPAAAKSDGYDRTVQDAAKHNNFAQAMHFSASDEASQREMIVRAYDKLAEGPLASTFKEHKLETSWNTALEKSRESACEDAWVKKCTDEYNKKEKEVIDTWNKENSDDQRYHAKIDSLPWQSIMMTDKDKAQYAEHRAEFRKQYDNYAAAKDPEYQKFVENFERTYDAANDLDYKKFQAGFTKSRDIMIEGYMSNTHADRQRSLADMVALSENPEKFQAAVKEKLQVSNVNYELAGNESTGMIENMQSARFWTAQLAYKSGMGLSDARLAGDKAAQAMAEGYSRDEVVAAARVQYPLDRQFRDMKDADLPPYMREAKQHALRLAMAEYMIDHTGSKPLTMEYIEANWKPMTADGGTGPLTEAERKAESNKDTTAWRNLQARASEIVVGERRYLLEWEKDLATLAERAEGRMQLASNAHTHKSQEYLKRVMDELGIKTTVVGTSEKSTPEEKLAQAEKLYALSEVLQKNSTVKELVQVAYKRGELLQQYNELAGEGVTNPVEYALKAASIAAKSSPEMQKEMLKQEKDEFNQEQKLVALPTNDAGKADLLASVRASRKTVGGIRLDTDNPSETVMPVLPLVNKAQDQVATVRNTGTPRQ